MTREPPRHLPSSLYLPVTSLIFSFLLVSTMSYNYGDYKQQNNYAQPYPGPPSRQPTARSGATSFDANPSGAGTRMNSFDPYSATSSRQQLNDPAGMRYRDDVSARPAPVETAVEGAGAGAGVRRSASHWSPTTPMSRCVEHLSLAVAC